MRHETEPADHSMFWELTDEQLDALGEEHKRRFFGTPATQQLNEYSAIEIDKIAFDTLSSALIPSRQGNPFFKFSNRVNI